MVKLLFRDLAFGNVLGLKDKVHRLAGIIEHARHADRSPNGRLVLMNEPARTSTCDGPSFDHVIDRREALAELFNMRDALKVKGKQLAIGIAEKLAQRRVDAEPTAIGRYKCHPDGGVVKRAAEMFLAFTKAL